jgi:hypothetical protein
MRRNFEREHENCPHCGRNSCSWHMPGRFCWYAYEDLPGEVKRPKKPEPNEPEENKSLFGG